MDSDRPSQAVPATIRARLAQLESDHAALRQQLYDSLAREAAISDVLKGISRAAFDLDPILTTIVEHGTRLCHATSGWIYRYNGEFLPVSRRLRRVARHQRDHRSRPRFPRLRHDRGPPGRRAGSCTSATSMTIRGTPGSALPPLERYHTGLGVPLLRDDGLLGAMVMLRAEIEDFSEREIQLLETFADQAVIAIENAGCSAS